MNSAHLETFERVVEPPSGGHPTQTVSLADRVCGQKANAFSVQEVFEFTAKADDYDNIDQQLGLSSLQS